MLKQKIPKLTRNTRKLFLFRQPNFSHCKLLKIDLESNDVEREHVPKVASPFEQFLDLFTMQVMNGGSMAAAGSGNGYHQSYHRESHYSSGGGGAAYGTNNRVVGSRSKFIAPENGPTYAVVRK